MSSSSKIDSVPGNRWRLTMVIVLLALGMFGTGLVAWLKLGRKPGTDVVMIVVNVMRADHLASYGYGRETTPALDDLAEESYVFDRAFAQVGYTLPSMASIMTSLYPQSHRVYDAYKDEITKQVPTLAEVLRQKGYVTAWFSRLTEPHLALVAGFGRGFDLHAELGTRFEGKERLFRWLENLGSEPFFLAMNIRHAHSPYLPLPKYRKRFTAGKVKLPIESQAELLREVYDTLLEEINDQRSPLYGAFEPNEIAAHPEYFAGGFTETKLEGLETLIDPDRRHLLDELRVRVYNRKLMPAGEDRLPTLTAYYDACLLGVDQEIIGPLLEILKRKGRYDRTMIVVTGDHGESLGEHGLYGHGMQYYDQFIHVPLIVKMPGPGHAREDISTLVGGVDLMPTILAAVGIEPPATAQGADILPAALGIKSVAPEFLFGENRYYGFLRSARWKLIVARERADNLPFVDQLFDLVADPEELRDVKEVYPEVYRQLRLRVMDHLAGLPVYVDRTYQFKPEISDATKRKIRETGYW